MFTSTPNDADRSQVHACLRSAPVRSAPVSPDACEEISIQKIVYWSCECLSPMPSPLFLLIAISASLSLYLNALYLKFSIGWNIEFLVIKLQEGKSCIKSMNNSLVCCMMLTCSKQNIFWAIFHFL